MPAQKLEWSPGADHYVLDDPSNLQREITERFRGNLLFFFSKLGPKFMSVPLGVQQADRHHQHLSSAINDIDDFVNLETFQLTQVGKLPCYRDVGLFGRSVFNGGTVEAACRQSVGGARRRYVGLFQLLDSRTIGVGVHQAFGPGDDCFSAVLKI